MSTQGDTITSVRGYHEYNGGCSVHRCFFTNSIVLPMTLPHIYYDILLVYCIPPSVLMIFPTVLMISADVLNISQCTAHPPVYCTDPMHCG